MWSLKSLVLTAFVTSLFRSCTADIGFSSPAAGTTISGSTIDVEFEEGSGSPALSDFTGYTLQLCAGGNTEATYTILLTFTSTGDFSTSTYSADITDLTIGGNTENAYFLRTIGVAPGGVVYNFSPRFTLSSMTGTFSTAIQTALSSVSGTSGPDTVNAIVAAGSAAAAPAAGSFSIAYTMQTGPIRYAPMAKVAPSKITAKGNARAYPTSDYSVWLRSGMPAPDASQTVTDAFTFSTNSVEPTIAVQSMPTGDSDMQKFLNRWKD